MRDLRLRRYGAAIGVGACVASIAAISGSSGATVLRGSTNRPFAGQTLTVLTGAPGGAGGRAQNEWNQELAVLFHKETGATVRYTYYATEQAELTDLETAVVSGSGPEVMQYGSSNIATFAATGKFVKLTRADWSLLGGRNSFLPQALLDSGYGPNADYGIPINANPTVMAYNTRYFKGAGIKAPPNTWTEWVQDARKIQKKFRGVYGVGFDPADPFDPWKMVWSYTKQLGGDFAKPNGMTITLNTAAVKNALEFYFEQDTKFHIVPPTSLTWNNADMISAFTSQKVAMIPIAGYGTKIEAQGTPLQGHIAFAPLPSVPYGLKTRPAGGVAAGSIIAGNYWIIPTYDTTTERTLALEFERISVSPSIQLTQFKLLGYLPPTHAGVSAIERRYPSIKPFVAGEASATNTVISPAWSDIESGVLVTIGKIADYVALHHNHLSIGTVNAAAAQEQAAVQAEANAYRK